MKHGERIVCETLDCFAELGFSFDDFGNALSSRAPRSLPNNSLVHKSKAANPCSVVCELARKCHFHVCAVGCVKRHRDKQRIRLVTQTSHQITPAQQSADLRVRIIQTNLPGCIWCQWSKDKQAPATGFSAF